MKQLRILHQDEDIVVVDKPAGFQVHVSEDHPRATHVVMKTLRNQLGKWVYPVHRLDRATSGVLVLALNVESARELHRQFQSREVGKTYLAWVRGWTDDEGVVESRLTKRLDGGPELEAKTEYRTLFRYERAHALGRYASVRYSLVEITPTTGRLHQIRRHLRRENHPIVGDTVHGDGPHNRLWREWCPGSGLFLKAYQLRFRHPTTHQWMMFQSKWNRQWHQLFDVCGFCPIPQARLKKEST